MQATLDVDHVSGVTFPATINPGDTWQHSLEFSGLCPHCRAKSREFGNLAMDKG